METSGCTPSCTSKENVGYNRICDNNKAPAINVTDESECDGES